MLNHSLKKLLFLSMAFSSSMLFTLHASSQQDKNKNTKQSDDSLRCPCNKKNPPKEITKTKSQLTRSASILEKNTQEKANSVEKKDRGPSSGPTSGSFTSLVVTGNEKVGGNLKVGSDLIVSGTLTGEEATTQSTLKIGGIDCCTQQGSLAVFGSGELQDGLRVGESVTAQTLTADTVTVTQSSSGSLTSSSENTGSLTVAKNATFYGPLLVDEIDPLNGQTVMFAGNVSVDSDHKLLVNEINPVTCGKIRALEEGTRSEGASKGTSSSSPCIGPCQQECLENDCGVTCFSGNVAVNPNKTLYVNEINPVGLDEDGHCIENDSNGVYTFFSGDVGVRTRLLANTIESTSVLSSNTNGEGCTTTILPVCFSGNVAVDPTKKLLTNTICPITNCITNDSDEASENRGMTRNSKCEECEEYDYPLPPCDGCIPDCSPCAATTFSGYLSVKNNHIFGQLDTLGIDPSSDRPMPITLDMQPIDPNLGYPTTTCVPVLRLSFTNTDTTQFSPFPNGPFIQQTPSSAKPFPQGAWVKLDITGVAQLNFNGLSQTADNKVCFDVFTELYFFVGPGFAAPCSAFVGTLNGINFSNTLSSQLCVTHNEFKSLPMRVPSPCTRPTATGLASTSALFGMAPTALDALSAPAIIGTTVSDASQPCSVDIMLMGVLPYIGDGGTTFNFDQNDYDYPIQLGEVLDPSCPFSISNITIYFEVISPNVKTVCFPCPTELLPQEAYTTGCENLINCLRFTDTDYPNLPFNADSDLNDTILT